MFFKANTIKKKLLITSIIPFLIMSGIVIGVMVYNNYIVKGQKEILDNLYFYKNLSVAFNTLDNELNAVFPTMVEVHNKDTSLTAILELSRQLETYIDRALYSPSWSRIKGLGNMLETYKSSAEKIFNLITLKEPYYEELRYNRNVSKFIKERIELIVSIYLMESSTLYEKISDLSEKLRMALLVVFLMLIWILLLFIYKFAESISNPIISLSDKAKRVAAGEMDVSKVVVRSHDEIAVLASSFNEMVEKIRLLIQKILDQSQLESKLKEEEMRNLHALNYIKEAEIKRLKSQINPHFLFNTLNTISKMAMIEDAMTTHTLIQSTAQLLRYNLQNERKDKIFIRDEIDNIKEYVLIYKTRFHEKFEYVFTIDNRLLDIEVPFLILQPVVENAIIHGIEPKGDKGTLTIKLFAESSPSENFAVVEILDDGIGMTEEQLALLSEDKASGLGINNVKKRIEYFFGRKDLFSISRVKPTGTCVRIHVPLSVGKNV